VSFGDVHMSKNPTILRSKTRLLPECLSDRFCMPSSLTKQGTQSLRDGSRWPGGAISGPGRFRKNPMTSFLMCSVLCEVDMKHATLTPAQTQNCKILMWPVSGRIAYGTFIVELRPGAVGLRVLPPYIHCICTIWQSTTCTTIEHFSWV
jgi:hypothetical protein